jgi:hypothetical protein
MQTFEDLFDYTASGNNAGLPYDEARDNELTGIIKELVSEHHNNRAELAKNLLEKHEMLARPGCKGRWEPFLREVGIAKESARRLLHEERARLAQRALGNGIDPLESFTDDENEVDEENNSSEPKPSPRRKLAGETMLLRFTAGSKAAFLHRLDYLAKRSGESRRELLVNLVSVAYEALTCAESGTVAHAAHDVADTNETNERALPIAFPALQLMASPSNEAEAA